jgi:PKD repeat protein
VSSICGSTEYCETLVVECTAPQADFEFVASQLTVDFTDASNNAPTQWDWDFGDGNNSGIPNPSHTFSEPGTYIVCLTSSSVCGSTEVCQAIMVSCNAPQSNFTVSNNELEVDFTDISTNNPEDWLWSFGDGANSTVQNPTHIYDSPGEYVVCLEVTGFCGSTERCELIEISCTPPQAAFGYEADELQVVFQDSSSDEALSWLWDFGDGQASTLQAPAHTYAGPGAYEVCLTVEGICGSNQFCESIEVNCTPPWVNFDWISEGNTISFFQLADNSVTEWSWDFGDGNTSDTPNPLHTYDSSGEYNVCLTATDPCGTATFCDTLNIVVTDVKEFPAQLVRLFPNPAGQEAWLMAPISAVGQVTLYDVNGREVAEWVMASKELRIPLAPYPAGTYILKLETPDFHWQERLLIIR